MLTLALTSLSTLSGYYNGYHNDYYNRGDITYQIPEINGNRHNIQNFLKISDVAQYKNADWSNALYMARGISIEEAMAIADNDPLITYFFYTKAMGMMLECQDGSYRSFEYGDTVFFTGSPHWGSAPGLADGYIK